MAVLGVYESASPSWPSRSKAEAEALPLGQKGSVSSWRRGAWVVLSLSFGEEGEWEA
ncbi:hypothetical protein Csa_023835 [Cucumis sativus]|nr:hypothetical protein Csa_023835 [Cucumis sativus]